MSRLLMAACIGVGLAAMQVPAFAASPRAADAASQPCRMDRILNASGRLITLGSGLAYQAYPGSAPTMSDWLPQDRVRVCRIGGTSVKITDLSKKHRKNETVRALRIFPGNTGGLI